ncbi:MAG: cytidine deaminase [Bacteroidota bacterium]
MKKITYSFEYQVYPSAAELPAADLELLDRAKLAVTSSHAPYSRYHVGAAVKLADGHIVAGSNQENMAFPAGLCAERVAVFSAVSTYPGVPIAALAITATAEAFGVSAPVPPCGMCRQAIVEYEMKYGNKIRVILGGLSGEVYVIQGMETLLPLTFHEDGLAKK